MKLDLSEIAANLGKRNNCEINEPPIENLGDGLKCVSQITGKIDFVNTGSLIVVRGFFKTRLELECSRCIQSYLMDIEIPIEEGLSIEGHQFVDESIKAIDEIDLPEEEKEPVFENNIFNLNEVMRQSIIVALPIKNLCSQECKGICSGCAVDMNIEECKCSKEISDSPFAVLESLVEKKTD